MVQINLPENSKVQKGKYYKDKTGSKNIRKVNVLPRTVMSYSVLRDSVKMHRYSVN